MGNFRRPTVMSLQKRSRHRRAAELACMVDRCRRAPENQGAAGREGVSGPDPDRRCARQPASIDADARRPRARTATALAAATATAKTACKAAFSNHSAPTFAASIRRRVLPDLFLAAAMVAASGYRHNFGAQSDDPRSPRLTEDSPSPRMLAGSIGYAHSDCQRRPSAGLRRSLR
jgi:hypothetical protein